MTHTLLLLLHWRANSVTPGFLEVLARSRYLLKLFGIQAGKGNDGDRLIGFNQPFPLPDKTG